MVFAVLLALAVDEWRETRLRANLELQDSLLEKYEDFTGDIPAP